MTEVQGYLSHIMASSSSNSNRQGQKGGDYKGYRIIPTPPFEDNELMDALHEQIKTVPKPLRRRIEDYRRTPSYAILADLHNKIQKGDRTAMNTVNFNSLAQKDWWTFALLSTVIHKIDTKTKKEIEDTEKQIEKQRVYYTVKYYIDQQTGEPIIVESDAPKTPLNKDTSLAYG